MVIKVNQVCSNYFVEKNVPMVNFVLSDTQGGISPPDRTHWITRWGFTHLKIDMFAIWDVFGFPRRMQGFGSYDTVCVGDLDDRRSPSPGVQNNTIPLYFSNWFTCWMSAYEQHFLLNTPAALWNAPSYPAWPSAAPSKGHAWPRGPVPALLALCEDVLHSLNHLKWHQTPLHR